MRRVLCLVARHRWETRHNPEIEGARGDDQPCLRCTTDKAVYEAPPKTMWRGVWL